MSLGESGISKSLHVALEVFQEKLMTACRVMRGVTSSTWQANMGMEGVAFTRSPDERGRGKAEIYSKF